MFDRILNLQDIFFMTRLKHFDQWLLFKNCESEKYVFDENIIRYMIV